VKHRRLPIVVALVALLLSACSVAADPYCDFPPGTPLAFSGWTTLTAIGLDQLGPVEAHDQVGMIYVTANEIEHEALLPEDQPARVYCGVYEDDQQVAGVIGPVPDNWQPPSPSPESG
jgi:hypothetical protein